MLGKIVETGQDTIYIKLDGKSKFKLGETVNVSPKKTTRTLKQNAYYWCFLTWCIHPAGADLQSQGHFSADGLHADIKAWIKDNHGHDFPIDKHFTTTELTKEEFHRFFELVNQELMIEFFGVDTTPFFVSYEKWGRWFEYGNNKEFRDFMNEQVPAVPF